MRPLMLLTVALALLVTTAGAASAQCGPTGCPILPRGLVPATALTLSPSPSPSPVWGEGRIVAASPPVLRVPVQFRPVGPVHRPGLLERLFGRPR